MPESFQVGPFLVDSRMLIYIFSIIVGLTVMKFKMKNSKYFFKPMIDLMLSNVLIVVLIWKFGALLFTPSILWTKPFQILMLVGSWRELVLGIIIAFVYTWFKLKKMGVSLIFLLDLLSYGILSAAMCKSLLAWEYGMMTNVPWGISLTDSNYQYHPLNVYVLFVSAAILMWLWWRTDTLGQGKTTQDFFIFYGIGMLIISYFKISDIFLLYFSVEQMLYIGMIVFGMSIQYILKKRKKGDDFIGA